MAILANTIGQNLAEHCFAVGYLSRCLFKRIINSEEKVNLIKLVFLVGCLHDMGKIDPCFQEWVKKTKNNGDYNDSDGEHIDSGKYTFDKHPRHNEISASLLSLCLNRSKLGLNNTLIEFLLNIVFWHHTKPYRKEKKFENYSSIIETINDNKSEIIINNLEQFLLELINIVLNNNDDCNSLKQLINTLNDIVNKSTNRFIISNAIKNELPNYKIYEQFSCFDDLRNKIRFNAILDIMRSCVIAADRIVSSLSSEELSGKIKEKNIEFLIEGKLEVNRPLSLDYNLISFPESERTLKQNSIAQKLYNIQNIAVLSGAAGCGKTRIALEWAKLGKAKRIIWICPRVQICQGVFTELITQYLKDEKIEIYTGEFKYTNSWDTETPINEELSSSIIVTTIDQIFNSISTHSKVDLMMLFLNSHVVFDEYHEYCNMDIFNVLFAELIECKKLKKGEEINSLLVSATPNYCYLKNILDISNELDIVCMPSFNNSTYKINYIICDDSEDETGLFINKAVKDIKSETIIITNMAKYAQANYIRNFGKENAVLFHSKLKKSDKSIIFNNIISSFGKNGDKKYSILRSGPIVQASLNITCKEMFSEISSPENFLQRLGRLDRFGESDSINNYNIIVTENVINDKINGTQACFLNKMHNLHTSASWYHFLKNELKQPFKLDEIYNAYKRFYSEIDTISKCEIDLNNSIKSSIELINKKLLEPIKILTKKNKAKKLKIRNVSLRGDSRFINVALLQIGVDGNIKLLDEYACVNSEETLTENIEKIRNTGLDYMKKKHHNIFGVSKFYSQEEILEKARDSEFPVYLSYILSDLKKVGENEPEECFVYYVLCDKQAIGLMDYKVIKNI